MTAQIDRDRPIPGTTIFDGAVSRRGYRVNKLAMSLARAENRAAFAADEDAYLETHGLTEEERRAVRARDWRAVIEDHGGNIYMVIKIGAVVGHGLYQIGAHQRGESFETFLATRAASGAR